MQKPPNIYLKKGNIFTSANHQQIDAALGLQRAQVQGIVINKYEKGGFRLPFMLISEIDT